MSKQANPTVIGGFVLGALTLAVVAVLVFSSGAWMRERVPIVTDFSTTVQGLNVGSQVLFQGVPVGQVTNIGVDYAPAPERFRIRVSYEVWPRQLQIVDVADGGSMRELLQELVQEGGLRAKLESVSFVTGQYVVTLGLEPDAPPPDFEPEPRGPVRIPPTPATRDQVEAILANIDLTELVASATRSLQALETLLASGELRSALRSLDGTLRSTEKLTTELQGSLAPMLERVNETLARYSELATTIESRVGPLADLLSERVTTLTDDVSDVAQTLDQSIPPVATAATAALDEARAAMRAVASLAGEGSSTRYELSQLLTEATRAAQSLRTLADYLERHPEALLQGKR
ncbi:MlaD family protein [Thiohalocapsa sp. ML1]|jgi:paraquat-inducible protein B|uniref:MlaD family protein n=1 Tax=Thiohalocapsa sp. ML1 TaxID=1431688 RepID=UPI000732386E|nr:MlaD family protein [Thiohalocapsa sp. ML1]